MKSNSVSNCCGVELGFRYMLVMYNGELSRLTTTVAVKLLDKLSTRSVCLTNLFLTSTRVGGCIKASEVWPEASWVVVYYAWFPDYKKVRFNGFVC